MYKLSGGQEGYHSETYACGCITGINTDQIIVIINDVISTNIQNGGACLRATPGCLYVLHLENPIALQLCPVCVGDQELLEGSSLCLGAPFHPTHPVEWPM